MQNPKKSKTTQFIVVILLALTVYFFMKYPLFFIAGLVAILAVLVLLYFKAPKFHAWVNGKFQRKPKIKTTQDLQKAFADWWDKATPEQRKEAELRKWYVENGFAGGKMTASIRQDNGIKSVTAAAYLCNGCGGVLQPVANWPKFMACEKCKTVQQKIN